MKTCVFAGTFDPITKGHEYVVEKCLKTFDKVIIAIGVNLEKKPMFSLEERLEIIKETFKDKEGVEVATFEGMLVDFMKSRGVIHTVRGIRNEEDYKYETTMAHFNQDMYDDVITIYMPTPAELTYVSSSAIRNIIAMGSDVSVYVPSTACAKIEEILKRR